jgi:hypothetical protein
MKAVPIVIIGGVVWLLLLVKYGSQQQQFLKRYNDVIVKCLLQDYDYYYSHTEYIDEDIYMHSPFNRMDYNTYTGEDLLAIKIPDVYGNFLDTTLMCSDLTVSYDVNPNGKSDKDHIAYTGAMGYVEFPFSFGCNLYINFNPLGLPKITLEDMQFNKKFRIYTDDELEARMILTTSFMIRLVEYAKRFPWSAIIFTRDGKMYFHLPRNLFEAQTWKTSSKYAMFESHYDDIANIMALIDEIRNNDKLFQYYD